MKTKVFYRPAFEAAQGRMPLMHAAEKAGLPRSVIDAVPSKNLDLVIEFDIDT